MSRDAFVDDQTIHLTAPARIHVTLIDMHGSFSGRVDGGVGFALDQPQLELTARKFTTDGKFTVGGPAAADLEDESVEQIYTLLDLLSRRFGLGGVQLQFKHAIPAHAGLGSKTAHLLAAAHAYLKLYGISLPPRRTASLIGRGGTSGIGVETFYHGGLIVDCGHAFAEKGNNFTASSHSRTIRPASVLGRYRFPEWPILIATPVGKKIHGKIEQAYFEEVCPVPLQDVREVCHAVLMMLIPAVMEDDIDLFGKAISLIQQCRWKAFEIQAQAPVVGDVMRYLSSEGLAGVGMSSWGTAVYAVGRQLTQESEVQRLLEGVQKTMDAHQGGRCWLTTASNVGHQLSQHQFRLAC